MAGGLFGWLDAVWLQLSSIFSVDRKKILATPTVAGEILDREVASMIKDFNVHENAVAELMAIAITDEKTRSRLLKEKADLEDESTGAAETAKERGGKLQKDGKTIEEIEADPEYAEAKQAYEDNASTIAEKDARIADLTQRIDLNNEKIGGHKLMLQKIQREIQAKKVAAKDTVAQMSADQALIRVNKSLSNLSERKEDKDAQEVREVAATLSARAQISGELAGNDATVQREKYKLKAQKRKSGDAFAALVGLAASKDAAPSAPVATSDKDAATKLP